MPLAEGHLPRGQKFRLTPALNSSIGACWPESRPRNEESGFAKGDPTGGQNVPDGAVMYTIVT